MALLAGIEAATEEAGGSLRSREGTEGLGGREGSQGGATSLKHFGTRECDGKDREYKRCDRVRRKGDR